MLKNAEVRSDTPEEQTTVADSTPEEQTTLAEKGSYENPASMGESIVLTSDDNTYEVSILDVIRGDKANNLVKSANQFNEEPASGYEYLLVKVKVAYTEGKDPVDISYRDFKVYADGAETTQPFSTVYSNEFIKLDTGNIMPGGNKEGWVSFTVPQDKKAVIAFQHDDSTASYLSIEN